jgi:carboxylate-amine ligase
MTYPEPPFTVGIEEEYLLVHRDTGEVDNDPPPELLKECTERGAGQIAPEFLRSQIEVSTCVCRTLAEARQDLARLRAIIVEVSGRYGLAPMAASTHPFSRATAQKPTDQHYYAAMAQEMQATARRLMICGMHVHVGIDDDDLRIDLMNQLSYFLPHMMALSCSSPFWEGEQTGWKSTTHCRARACPSGSTATASSGGTSTRSSATGSSKTPPRSGGICARARATRRSKRASWTAARASTMRSAWQR